MTEPTEPIDFDSLKPENSAPLPDDPVTPNPKASKEKKTSWLKPVGDKADVPPRRTTPRRKPAPRAKHGAFTEPLTQTYGAIGAVLFSFDPVCGKAIIEAAPKCAESLDDLAYQNETVRRVLTSLTTTSAVGAVIAAHAPILMAVYLHHTQSGAMGSSFLGKQFADNVEADMRKDNPDAA